MGAKAWKYFVPFEPRVEAALEKLRQRVFTSGEYRGSEEKPATPEEAVANMGASGTASILDVTAVSELPTFRGVCPLTDGELDALFGTGQPAHGMIESDVRIYEDIERGQSVYVVVYEGGSPSEYLFAGYSFD